jgi:hypothetical protein
MPSASDITSGLARIAQEGAVVAIALHALLILWGIAWFAGFRPSPRAVAAGASTTLLSVGLAALWFGNPFNGTVFLVFSPLLLLLALRGEPSALPRGRSRTFCVLDWLSLLFGWCYPHFLPEQPAWVYFYAAPLGLIPCPSLAFVCGLRLLGIARAGSAWSLVVAALALFYSLFGVFLLQVTLDVFLLLGALALGAQQWHERVPRERHRSRQLEP